jgi:glycosyltransferase involved in cell wall biosynthesis
LTRAVESALEQDLGPELHEVIVVNDSGSPLEEADWLKSPQVIVVNTNRCERSVARNVGAAVASGKYLHFLDDDDYLLPGGLKALLKVAESSDSAWVYGAQRCVRYDGSFVRDNRPEVKGNLFGPLVAGEALSLIPSLISRESFFRVGGFDPALIVLQDRDLACRLALISDFDRAGELIACVRVGPEGSTTNRAKAPWASRVLREKAFDAPGALARLLDSVRGNVFLRGRVCRAYLFSAGLNVLAGRFFAGASRLCSYLRLAAFYLFWPDFWRGMFYSVGRRDQKPR